MPAAKSMSKRQLISLLAEKLSMTKKDASGFMDLLADIAYKETKKKGSFVLPGFGKLVKVQHKARIGRNLTTGEAIKIKAKTVVKFRVAKACKDAVL